MLYVRVQRTILPNTNNDNSNTNTNNKQLTTTINKNVVGKDTSSDPAGAFNRGRQLTIATQFWDFKLRIVTLRAPFLANHTAPILNKIGYPKQPNRRKIIILNLKFWFDTKLIFFTSVGFMFLDKFRCESPINSRFTRTTFNTGSYKSLPANHSCKLFNHSVFLSAS